MKCFATFFTAEIRPDVNSDAVAILIFAHFICLRKPLLVCMSQLLPVSQQISSGSEDSDLAE